MTSALRLIHRADVLAQLLAAIATVPAGVKLGIPQLRDTLVNQADVIGGIEALIIAGELDGATLRPPIAVAASETGCEPLTEPVTGAKLADALTAYGARHGLAQWRISQHLFTGRNAIARMRRSMRPQRGTVAKVRAFLAAAPPEGMTRRAAGGSRTAEVGVTGAELAAELDTLIAEHGLSKTAVGLHLYNSRAGIEVLRKSRPHAATVAKVRALIADPPLDELRSRALGAKEPQASRAARAGKREPDGGGMSTPVAVPVPDPVPAPPVVAIGPESTWLKPAEIAWCQQCEARVSGTKAASCTSPWCKLKGAADDQQRKVA